MSTHTPIRPTWACAGCGLGWPCPTRARELLAEYADDQTSLMAFLAAEMLDCGRDLPAIAPTDLVARFLALPFAAKQLPRRNTIEHYRRGWDR